MQDSIKQWVTLDEVGVDREQDRGPEGLPPTETESRISRMLGRVSDGIVALDRDWRYTYINEQAAALFGRLPGDLLGKHIWTEFPEGIGQPFHLVYERAVAEQQVVTFEDYYAPWDRWFENRVYPSPDGVTIFFHEVTARKQAERAERAASELNRQIVESPFQGISVIDPELRLVQVNAAFAAIVGLPEAELVGRRSRDLMPAARAEQNEILLRRALAGESFTTPVELAPRLVRGRPGWISRVFSPLRDVEGAIVGVISFVRDVTSQVESEAALKRGEARLQLALEAARAGVWDWNIATGLIIWSHEHERLWGMAPGTFRGTYEEFIAPIHPDDRDRVQRAVQQAIESRGRYAAEFRLRLTGGSERWIDGSGQAVTSEDGTAIRMLGTVVDITDRKRFELRLQCQTHVLESIAAGAPVSDTLTLLAHDVEAMAPDLVCSILRLDDDGVHVRHVAAPGLPGEMIHAIDGAMIGPNAGSCGTAAFTRAQVLTADLAIDPRWEDYRAVALPHHLRACWSTPLFDVGRRVRGTLALYRREAGLPDPWHLDVISMACHVAEIALEDDRSRAELAASERRYHDLYENAPDTYLTIDADGTISDCNATLTSFLGYSKAEVIGRPVLALVDPASGQTAPTALRQLFEVGHVHDVEVSFRHKDGRPLPISGNAIVVRSPDGSIHQARATVRDISRARHAEDELRQLSSSLLRSQDDERRRIARDLHDTTVQNLAALAMNLALIQKHRAVDDIQLVDECVALTDLSTQELRTLSYLLHPPVLEDFGLERAVHELVDGFARRSGVGVTIDVPSPVGRLRGDLELALFRVAQESLANVRRHSGSSTASVRLVRDGASITVEIRDAGSTRPAANASVGVGIAGMRERLRHLGGHLEVTFGPTGTSVRATAPITEGSR